MISYTIIIDASSSVNQRKKKLSHESSSSETVIFTPCFFFYQTCSEHLCFSVLFVLENVLFRVQNIIEFIHNQ